MAEKLSEAAVLKLLGKRTPLPGEGKPPGPNWERKAPKEPEVPQSMGSLADPLGLKKNLREKMDKADQGYRKGGKVRGCGIATKGFGKGMMK